MTYSGSYWTDNRVARLRVLWARDGMSASQIARELGEGVSRNAVLGKAFRLKLPSRGQTTSETGRQGSALIGKRNARKARRERLAKERASETHKSPLRRFLVSDGCPVIDDTKPASVVTLEDLQPHHCRWIYGDPKSDYGFCGCQKVAGTSYCASHAVRVFAVPTPEKKSAVVEKTEHARILEATS